MKTTQRNNEYLTGNKTLNACLGACEKLVKQLGQAKQNIIAEFRDVFQAQEQLLQQAIVEADALAWQTEYPHLLFPVLAAEKVQRAAQWQSRQQFLLENHSVYALAA